MKSWLLLLSFAVVFGGIGLLLAVLAFTTGEQMLLVGAAVFLVVGGIAGWLVPKMRREQAEPVEGAAGAVGGRDAGPGTWPIERVAAEIRRRLEPTPYEVLVKPDRIVVEADLADARFLGPGSVRDVRVLRGLEVVLRDDGRPLVRDFERDVDWTAGVGRFTGSARVFSGVTYKYERRVEVGADRDGVGAKVDYTTSWQQVRGPVVEVLKEAGWYGGWWASLPSEAKGAVVVGAIGASAIPIVPLVFLVQWLMDR